MSFAIFYNPDCLLCGEPVDDPFWDEYCHACRYGDVEDDEWDTDEDWEEG